jgi:cell division protein YceG involved in septum cleavage
MKKFISLLILVSLITAPVLAADFDIQEIPVQSNALDEVSDSYKITIHKGRYKLKNAMTHDELDKELHNGFYKYKKLIWVTCGIVLIFVAPEFVVAIAALAEAQQYLQNNCTINKNETVDIIVPAGEKPKLEPVK